MMIEAKAGSVGEVLDQIYRSSAVRSALFAFLVSRSLVFFLLLLGQYAGQNTDPVTHAVTITTREMSIRQQVDAAASAGDAGWYWRIAKEGYTRKQFWTEKEENWAFFPLFPLAWRAAMAVTGDEMRTGMALSHLFFFFALFFVYRCATAFGFDPSTADRAVFYAAIFPMSYFFSMPMTESLFLLLVAASLYYGKIEKWWLAGIIGAFATATRGQGVILIPVLLLLYFMTYRREWLKARLLWLGLVPVGLLSVMAMLYDATGNPLAMSVTAAWGRQFSLFTRPLVDYAQNPTLLIIGWDFKLMNFAVAVFALICGAVLLRQKQYVLGTFVLLCELMSLSTSLLQSQARYALVLFPMYFVMATWGAHSRVDRAIQVVSAGLLCVMTVLFGAHFVFTFS
jgi:hypothetical protein